MVVDTKGAFDGVTGLEPPLFGMSYHPPLLVQPALSEYRTPLRSLIRAVQGKVPQGK